MHNDMASDEAVVLREKLKIALQDARNLFDDGLLDSKEFKDLKAHELDKYKEDLAALTASSTSRAAEGTQPDLQSAEKMAAMTTPVRNPLTGRVRVEALRPSPSSSNSPTSPPTAMGDRSKRGKDEVVYVDAITYNRLTTPPIFRRRSRNKKKIVLPCAELQALQGLLQKEKADAE